MLTESPFQKQEAGALNLEPSVPMEEERHSLMDNKFHTR